MSDFEQAAGILRAAIDEHKPQHAFLCLSGGNDSLSVSHFAAQHIGRPFKVLHINTGIGIPETRNHVLRVCDKYGWDLLEIRAKEDCGQDYEQIVLKYGFPGPSQHRAMYIQLKERCLDELGRRHPKGRILLVSGVRKQESKRRMYLTEPVQRYKRRVWCSPFFYLSNTELSDYRADNDLPESQVRKFLCMSGECLCGAYAKRNELKEIELWFPETGKRLRELEKRVKAAGFPWGWDEKPPPRWAYLLRAKKAGQQEMFCTSCEFRAEAAA